MKAVVAVPLRCFAGVQRKKCDVNRPAQAIVGWDARTKAERRAEDAYVQATSVYQGPFPTITSNSICADSGTGAASEGAGSNTFTGCIFRNLCGPKIAHYRSSEKLDKFVETRENHRTYYALEAFEYADQHTS